MRTSTAALTATPIDSMVRLFEDAQDGLFAVAAVVVFGGALLALLENEHRRNIRESTEKVADAVSEETADPSKLAALVEIVRALAHPFDTVFRTSRGAIVALVVAGVLAVGAALVPVLATALLANHCKPHFPPPLPTVASSPSAASGVNPDDSAGDDTTGDDTTGDDTTGDDTTGDDTTGDDTTGDDTTGDDTTGDDTTAVVAVALQEEPSPQPSPVFAPGCEGEP